MEEKAAAASLAHSEALRAAFSPGGGSGRGCPRLWLGVLAESLDSGEHWLLQRQEMYRGQTLRVVFIGEPIINQH